MEVVIVSDGKALLLRALGDLARSKALYSELANQAEDPILRDWFKQAEERASQDLQWVHHVLRHKFGVVR